MFSRLLIKLIDEAILPAILLLATRIISVVLISKRLNFPFLMNSSGFIYSSLRQYVIINSYSMTAMILVIAVGLLYIIIKSYIFHESHISPHLTARLFALNVPSFIQNSFELYSQGAIWLSYLYLLLIISGLMAFFGLVFSYVFYLALGITLISNGLLILDIENEMKISKNKTAVYDTDEIYLESDIENE